MLPQKQPLDNSNIHPGSDPITHEGVFTDTPEDDVDVTVDEIFKYVTGDVIPDGLEVVNNGLQAASTCTEEADPDTLGETSSLSPSDPQSPKLGCGMRVKWQHNLEEGMAIFDF